MPNIANVLKAEITRLARKEVREESDGQKKAVASHRAEIAGLKRRVQALEVLVKRLTKAQVVGAPAPARGAASKKSVDATDAEHRFSAKGMATNRKRLALSAADFALLLGTTGQSIYSWEAGKSRPRPEAVTSIAALRGIGKREVAARLAALKAR